MASKQGAAITPERAGYGGLKAISLGDTPIKLAFALATTTKAREGVTLDEFVVRTMAAGMPLWWRPVKVGELTWFVRQPGTAASQRRGTTHVCAHRAKKGTVETCAGGHAGKASACSFEFRSAGDGVRRWRNGPDAEGNAHVAPAFDGNASATVKAARAAMASHLASLATRGFTVADMLATPSIADAIERGMAATPAPKRKRAKAAKAATVEAPQANESNGDAT